MHSALLQRGVGEALLEAALDEIAQVPQVLVGVDLSDASFPCEGWPVVLEHKLRIAHHGVEVGVRAQRIDRDALATGICNLQQPSVVCISKFDTVNATDSTCTAPYLLISCLSAPSFA
jgi:hypothetical protein